MPDDHIGIEALRQAEATIAILQTYVVALAGTIALMGAFFGYRWLSAIVDCTKAADAQAASNEKLAEAVKGLTEAVNHERN